MVKIAVDRTDLAKILAAIDRVKQVVLSMAALIPEESAREFSDQLKSNITSQKYGDFGNPHTNWKKGSQNEGMYWLWLGTVLKSITPFKLNSPAGFMRWFVGLKYSGAGLSNAPGGGGQNKATSYIKNGKKVQTKTKLSPQQERDKAIKREQVAARKAASTGVKVFSKADIATYQVQVKNRAGTQLGGGTSASIGHQIVNKKIISDTSSD
jgi:hypothetical protein